MSKFKAGCAKCGHEKSQVVNSRPCEEWINRRRKCLKCGYRWTTYEVGSDYLERIRCAWERTPPGRIVEATIEAFAKA